MKRVGLYIRVSTLEQAQEGYSVGEQKERLIAFCKAHDWLVADMYIDGGYTGSNLDRPGMQKLISEVDKLDIVLVYKLDRLSRSQRDTLYLIEEIFLPNSVDFVSMNESFDTGTPFGRAMIGILSVFAQLEREQIKERTRMGRIARAKQGLYFGGGKIPIGYDYRNNRLEVNEYEAVQIRKIFEWYSEGMTAHKVAEKLRGEGFTNKYSGWQDAEYKRTILYILSNDIYTGTMRYEDVVIENAHEAIISKELFDKVQEIRRKRQKTFGDTAYVSSNLLTGMIFCARCGARYGFKRSKKYTYYSCYSRSKASKLMIKADHCDNKTWSADDLENAVVSQINKLFFQKGYYEAIVSHHEKEKKKKPKELSEADTIKAKIADCDKQISKLMDLFQSDSIPPDVLSSRIDAIYREKVQLTENLQKIEPQKVQPKDFDDESIKKMLDDLADIWETSDLAEKKQILETLVERIELDGENVHIEWSFLT